MCSGLEGLSWGTLFMQYGQLHAVSPLGCWYVPYRYRACWTSGFTKTFHRLFETHILVKVYSHVKPYIFVELYFVGIKRGAGWVICLEILGFINWLIYRLTNYPPLALTIILPWPPLALTCHAGPKQSTLHICTYLLKSITSLALKCSCPYCTPGIECAAMFIGLVAPSAFDQVALLLTFLGLGARHTNWWLRNTKVQSRPPESSLCSRRRKARVLQVNKTHDLTFDTEMCEAVATADLSTNVLCSFK